VIACGQKIVSLSRDSVGRRQTSRPKMTQLGLQLFTQVHAGRWRLHRRLHVSLAQCRDRRIGCCDLTSRSASTNAIQFSNNRGPRGLGSVISTAGPL